MTKQEAINKALKLLGALEALPDSEDVDIMNAVIRDGGLTVQLRGGIDAVAAVLGYPVSTSILDSPYIHQEIRVNRCKYVQLKKIELDSAVLRAALGIDGAVLDTAEDIKR